MNECVLVLTLVLCNVSSLKHQETKPESPISCLISNPLVFRVPCIKARPHCSGSF